MLGRWAVSSMEKATHYRSILGRKPPAHRTMLRYLANRFWPKQMPTTKQPSPLLTSASNQPAITFQTVSLPVIAGSEFPSRTTDRMPGRLRAALFLRGGEGRCYSRASVTSTESFAVTSTAVPNSTNPPNASEIVLLVSSCPDYFPEPAFCGSFWAFAGFNRKVEFSFFTGQLVATSLAVATWRVQILLPVSAKRTPINFRRAPRVNTSVG